MFYFTFPNVFGKMIASRRTGDGKPQGKGTQVIMTHTITLTDEQFALLDSILALRPKDEPVSEQSSAFPKGTTCTGTKGDGTECHAPAKAGTNRCRHHPHGAKPSKRKQAQKSVASSTGKIHGKSLAKLEKALTEGKAFESGNGTTLGELKANCRTIAKARKGKFVYDSHEDFQGVKMAHHTLTLGTKFGDWDVYTRKARGTGEKRVAGTQAFVPMG